MGSNLTVTLEPPSTSSGKREYVNDHELLVSKGTSAGSDKITFAANNHNFMVVIPEADSLFTAPVDKTLSFRVSTSAPVDTPTINDNVIVDTKYEYHVFCEEERDWAHKPGASPPKIIIID